MNIAIMGTGGIGGYFGGLLAQAGHDVTFIARGAHLDAICTHGLQIESVNGNFRVQPAKATNAPETIGHVDLVLLCVKTYGLPEACEQIRPIVGPHTAIVTLQNGVDAPDQVAEAFGRAAILPGVAYCEAAIKAPGIIFQGSSARRIVFGEPDGSITPRALALHKALAGSGADAVLSENVLGTLWSKCCFICAMSGVTTLARQPLGALLADPESRALLQIVIEEVHAVARANGIELDTDPVESGIAIAERFPFSTKSSMLRDLERGGQLEIEALNGAVVRRGRALGIPTPANQAIYAALRFMQPDAIADRR